MPGEDAPPPRLIVTIGLHSSASTWVFNVVRELMIASVGEAQVLALYADQVAQVPDEATLDGRCLVIKSHHGSAELDSWLAAQQARMLLSVRDPRDACISMAQRFKATLNQTVRWIANDCNRLMRVASPGHALLRYEDRFFEDQASVGLVAKALGVRLAPAAIEAIFVRYRTEAVRSFAQRLAELPPERLTMVGAFVMDTVTQILAPHIGDTSSGKWRGLPDPLRGELTRLFGVFLDRFGYER
jgi:hypothetical protein